MFRMAILSSAAALAMSLPAAAQQYGYDGYGYDSYGTQNQGYYNNSNCESERRSNQTAGGLVGAIAGGLLGAAIADDGDNNRRRGHRGYSRGWDRGYGHGHRRGHRGGNDNGDQIAGALIGAVVGGVAGSAIAGSSSNCNTQAYNSGPNPRYGSTNVAPPTRQAYGIGWNDDAQPVRLQNGYYQGQYDQDVYDLRPGEELYGASTSYGATTGATTTGYNAGYTAPRDTGECRTVYRETYINGQRVSEPATACNVGGDRWEFVD